MPDKKQILLIDDDHQIVRALSVRLRALGYETVAAHDGRQGLDMAADHIPSAIVLDIRMPNMDGLAVLEELRRQECTRDIPVVVLSASAVDQARALDSGARYFLEKPYQAENLMAALRAVT